MGKGKWNNCHPIFNIKKMYYKKISILLFCIDNAKCKSWNKKKCILCLILQLFFSFECRDILPNEKNVTHKEMFTPEKDGQRTVTVSFNSKQITDIKNTISATVNSWKQSYYFIYCKITNTSIFFSWSLILQ